MSVKAIKERVEVSLRPSRTQEILGVLITRGPLSEIKKQADEFYYKEKGEMDGKK